MTARHLIAWMVRRRRFAFRSAAATFRRSAMSDAISSSMSLAVGLRMRPSLSRAGGSHNADIWRACVLLPVIKSARRMPTMQRAPKCDYYLP
jgi:hypothetical protein